jgi:uncharacterized protein YjbI with pentapeptide repeats
MDTPEPAPRADDDKNAATRRAGHESTLHRAETLLTSINEVAASTRNLFVTLLLFMLYIAITAASTTDEQLLRDSAIAVPLLPAANVPASSFYGIAPLLLLILHLELLLNLDRLCIRMRMFREVKARLRKYELPFLISQLSSFQMVQWSLGSNERIIRALTGTIMFLSTAFAPLLILLDLQYAFLAFHSTPITTLQRSVVAFDALLILAFWPRLMKARHDPRTSGPPVARLLRTLLRPWWLLPLLAVFVSLLVLRLPDDAFERFLSSHVGKPVLCASLENTPGPEGLRPKAPIDVFTPPYCAGLRAHRSLDLRGLDLSNPPASPEIVGALRSGKNSEIAEALKKVNGLDLTGRDLRGADFSFALIPKMNLEEANLESANFSYSRLLATNISANLRRTRFLYTYIYQSHLDPETMSGALVYRSIISSTIFGGNLMSSHFVESEITDSSFPGAHASNIEFEHVGVTASLFIGTILTGTRFHDSRIVRSSFNDATLDAASFDETFIQASHFEGASIKAPRFSHTNVSLSRFQGLRDGVCNDAGERNHYFPNNASANLNIMQDQPAAGHVRPTDRCEPIPTDARTIAKRETALLKHLCEHDDHRTLTVGLGIVVGESADFKRRLAKVAGNPKTCPGVPPISPQRLESLVKAQKYSELPAPPVALPMPQRLHSAFAPTQPHRP